MSASTTCPMKVTVKPWIIIQARASSTRLPRKIFKELCGKTLLEHQIGRLQQVKAASGIVVATTRKAADDETAALAQRCGVQFYRGDEEDVLSRYFEAALFCGAKSLVRITSDCPLIDADIVDGVIHKFIEARADYVSNTLKRSFPRGLDTEVFTFESLRMAFFEATSPSEREHVTPFIRKNDTRFRCLSVENVEDLSGYRWTVDTMEDFELIRHIYEAQASSVNEGRDPHDRLNHLGMKRVLEILKEHPEWSQINAHIEQKKSD